MDQVRTRRLTPVRQWVLSRTRLALTLVLGVPAALLTPAAPAWAVGETCEEVLTAWVSTEDVYTVTSIDQLYCLGTDAGGSRLGASFLQSGDMAWSDVSVDTDASTDGVQLPVEWSIIGSDGQPFTGDYDGAGHSISGLTWYHSDGGDDVGMFGVLRNAEVGSVALVNVVMGGLYNVGGLAGQVQEATSVHDVHVSGAISTGQNGDGFVGDYAGGIAGRAQGVNGSSPRIRDSSFDGSVASRGIRVGGIVGYGARLELHGVSVGLSSPTTVTITRGAPSPNNPNSSSHHSFVGGVAGVLEDSTIDRSRFHGVVTGKNLVGGITGRIVSGHVKRTSASGTVRGRGMTGGIAGWAEQAVLSDVVSTATVEQPLDDSDGGGSNANFVGGIVGLVDGSGSVQRALNFGSVRGYSYVGGIAGTVVLIAAVFDPLGYGGANGGGSIDQSMSTGSITATYSNQISGALLSSTSWGGSEGSIQRSFALEGTAAYTVDRGRVDSGVYLDRVANPFRTATELRSVSTYESTWNLLGGNGQLNSIVAGWYPSEDDFGPHFGLCAPVNDGYPFLLAIEQVMPSGCEVTSTPIRPEAPYDLTLVSSGNRVASLAFVPATTYGLATIQGYEYERVDSGEWTSLTRVSEVDVNQGWAVTGLRNGATNTVKVRPVLSSGLGQASLALPITLAASEPDAPATVSAVAGDGALMISVGPGHDSGSPIIRHEYQVDSGPWTSLGADGALGPTEVSGLINGTTYSVRVRAVNDLGEGLPSSDLVVTLAVPSPPMPPPVVLQPDTVPVSPTPPMSVSPSPSTVPPSIAPGTTVPPSTAPVVATLPPAPPASVVTALPTAVEALVPDTSLATGDVVVMEYAGFVPGEFVQLIVASTPQILGSGFADSAGRVRLSGVLPVDLPVGPHTLALYAPQSGRGVRQPISIEVQVLPATGSPSTGAATPAMALVLVGLLWMVLGRRLGRRGRGVEGAGV